VNQSAGPASTPPSGQPPAAAAADPVAQQQLQRQAEQQRQAQQQARKIIRNGQIHFEVDSFDSAMLQVGKIAGEEGGFVATTDSEKLPNGKVRGSVTVRCPPDRLDTLVLKLRGLGDLKNQRIVAQDVTKKYVDTESQLRAAKAMEERLLAIIKAGGVVKDLLEAEKQLGVWREKREVLEGEMRYLDAQVALSTLVVELMERDVRTPTAAAETETVSAGIETDDVEKARADALAAIEQAKGRVVDSDLKKLEGGQLSATIVADVAPDAAGPVIDRLKQLGKVARLDVSRKTTTTGGVGPITPGLRVERKETRFQVNLYNLANIAPRQSTSLNLAAADVEATYRAILDQVKSAGGRVVTSQLNRPKADQTVGTVTFEAPADKADVLLGAVRAGVEVMRMEVTTNPDTRTRPRPSGGSACRCTRWPTCRPASRRRCQLAARNVPAAFNKLLDAARSAGGRVLTSQLNEQDANNVSGSIDFEVQRDKWPTVDAALQEAGLLVTRNVTRSPDAEGTVDSKIRLSLTLIDEVRLSPRETVAARVAVGTCRSRSRRWRRSPARPGRGWSGRT
jgi:glycine cleavage system regulatory protein